MSHKLFELEHNSKNQKASSELMFHKRDPN